MAASDGLILDTIAAGDVPLARLHLFERYRTNFSKAINQVFGAVEYGDKFFDTAQQLHVNVNRFAMFKANAAANSIYSAYAKGESMEAELKRYKRYQVAEYNTVVGRSRSAKQWLQFPDDENIEWLATRSSTPRELHQGFVGTVLPKSHPFWI